MYSFPLIDIFKSSSDTFVIDNNLPAILNSIFTKILWMLRQLLELTVVFWNTLAAVLFSSLVVKRIVLSIPCSLVITSLDMEAMVNTVEGWQENPIKFARSHGICVTPEAEDSDPDNGIHILIVEGFLLYNYKYVVFLQHLTC